MTRRGFLRNEVTGMNVDTPMMRENFTCSQGQFMYGLVERLFRICRSITGDGVRETLRDIAVHLPKLEVHEVPSGTKCCDWVVPDEWNIRDAHISDEQGKRIVDFQQHNLHVVGYSTPVYKVISRDELDEHLFSLPELPDAIPYVTSYYRRFWGFCVTENQRNALVDPRYRVVIDSSLISGSLTYADLVVPGESKEESHAIGAEEKEAACWAKRQALIAEIAAVPTMEWGALTRAYETRVRRWDWDKRLDSYPNRRHKEDEKVQEMLTYELPNC